MDKPPRVRRQSVRTKVSDLSAAPMAPAEEPQAPSIESVTPPAAIETPAPQTTIPDPQPMETPIVMNVETKTVKSTAPKRSKLGYAIRDDLIKKCKQIALDEDRFVYDIVEELLEEGIARRQRSQEI